MKRFVLAGGLATLLSVGAFAGSASAVPFGHMWGTGSGAFIGQVSAVSFHGSTETINEHISTSFYGALTGAANEYGAETVNTIASTSSWGFTGTISVLTSCGRLNETIIDSGEGSFAGNLFVGGGEIRGLGQQSLTIDYTQIGSNFTYSASWTCPNGSHVVI